MNGSTRPQNGASAQHFRASFLVFALEDRPRFGAIARGEKLALLVTEIRDNKIVTDGCVYTLEDCVCVWRGRNSSGISYCSRFPEAYLCSSGIALDMWVGLCTDLETWGQGLWSGRLGPEQGDLKGNNQESRNDSISVHQIKFQWQNSGIVTLGRHL